MMKNCTNCGNQIKASDAFCIKCGAKQETQLQSPYNLSENTSIDQIFKLSIIGISILMIIGTFLPFLKVMNETMSLFWVNGQMGDGIAYILLAVLCIAAVFKGKKLPVVVAGAAGVAMYCFETKRLKEAYGQLGELSGLITKGAGYHLIAFSVFALLIVAVLDYARKYLEKK